MEKPSSSPDLASVLRWYIDAGVDETIGDEPVNRYAAQAAQPAPALQPVATVATPTPITIPRSPVPAVAAAPQSSASSAHLAQACKTLDELRVAVESYDGCALKTFATRTVFADGNPKARVMVIGEAPGEDEDRQGKPFVGVSGKLLDRMLGSVGLDRATNAYITNIVFWRPPGNRKPTAEEIVLCMPFVQRHIELLDPALLLLVGGPSASTILANPQGITKLRGKWFDYESPGLPRPVPVMATFHPAYLLRSPQQKRFAWRDLLMFRQKYDSLTPV
ncbi:MAG: uracil-DNA glycosylase [Rhodospirillaceae bacterium]|nr:uracil-DNA glycosylase [Rhodospirillaceae bacterium]